MSQASYVGVPRLAALLQRMGDLPAGAQVLDLGNYRGALVDAVKRFHANLAAILGWPHLAAWSNAWA